MEALVFAQQDDAYFILIYIECHPKAIAWKGYKFFVAYVRQSGDCRDSRGKTGDDANLVGFELCDIGVAAMTEAIESATERSHQDSWLCSHLTTGADGVDGAGSEEEPDSVPF